MRVLPVGLCLLFVMFCTPVRAASLGTEEEARALAQSVMVEVAAGRVIKGLERLRPYNVYPKEEFDAMLAKTEEQLPAMQQRFGPSIGWDFVTVEKVGDTLRQFVFLQKFERHLMVWRF
ncbi:MAG: hypothetical protein HZB87_07680, partial [Desulfatitalea sp.]|nr:hypothetical protein [Desulfatitalea sp.]